jgi:glycosyltransferase involved in cell wall biosynthesis
VIAFARGGATETVVDGMSGVLFREQSVQGLIAAVERFNQMSFDPVRIAHSAQRFAAENFRNAFRDYVNSALESRSGDPSILLRDVSAPRKTLASSSAVYG